MARCSATSLFFFAACSIASCTDKGSQEQSGIARRAAALRLLPLPNMNDPNVPRAIFVNSSVPRILVQSSPEGARVTVRGRDAGITPCEVATADILVGPDTAESPFPLEFTLDGRTAKVTSFALRYEAANLMIGVASSRIPAPLARRDLWFYTELK
jgi:hypothetical protein